MVAFAIRIFTHDGATRRCEVRIQAHKNIIYKLYVWCYEYIRVYMIKWRQHCNDMIAPNTNLWVFTYAHAHTQHCREKWRMLGMTLRHFHAAISVLGYHRHRRIAHQMSTLFTYIYTHSATHKPLFKLLTIPENSNPSTCALIWFFIRNIAGALHRRRRHAVQKWIILSHNPYLYAYIYIYIVIWRATRFRVVRVCEPYWNRQIVKLPFNNSFHRIQSLIKQCYCCFSPPACTAMIVLYLFACELYFCPEHCDWKTI